MTRSAGVSLSEVLISLACSSFLIVIVMHQYLSVKFNYQQISLNLERAFEMQLISDFMRETLRQAGFTPCLGIEHLVTSDTRESLKKLHAIELGSPHEGGGFQVNYMSPLYDELVKQASLTEWLATETHPIRSNKPVLISDCTHAEVHLIKSVRREDGLQRVFFERPLNAVFVPPIYIGEWIEERFSTKTGTLYYETLHREALSDAVTHLAVSVSSNRLEPVVHVGLSLDNQQQVNLDTAIRTP